MSVYVGIDVHRKRSQVAVIDQDGRVAFHHPVLPGAPGKSCMAAYGLLDGRR
jgi:hypothetical protein